MSSNSGNSELEAIHKAGVRQLCKWRSEWGLAKFRKYISEKKISTELLHDYAIQYQLGNRGEYKCWKKPLLQQPGLDI